MFHDLLLSVALSVTAISPAGQDAAKAQDPGIVVQGEKEKKANKRTCKRSVPTGSVVPKITCRTVAEWQADAEKAQSAIEAIKNDRRTRDHTQASRDLLSQ
jgi:hypothetical protein